VTFTGEDAKDVESWMLQKVKARVFMAEERKSVEIGILRSTADTLTLPDMQFDEMLLTLC
jgi:hypothetical protein